LPSKVSNLREVGGTRLLVPRIKCMKIVVQAHGDEAAKVGAKFIAIKVREAIATRGRFVMAVSGGHEPWRMFQILANERLPWKAVHVVQVDERVASAGDPDRNLTHLRECFLSHVPLLPEQVHAMPVEGNDLQDGAASYSRELRQIAGSPPVLDLVHLGLGRDGHTASLVPNDPVLKVTDRDVAITGIYQGHRRMTLTYPILNRAHSILWLVVGPGKTEMFRRLRCGDATIPAGCIRQTAATAITDLDAAGVASLIETK
jgi:6-phosphogluconolactonase